MRASQLNTQHRVVVAKMRIEQKRAKRPQRRSGKIKWLKLKTEEVKVDFVKKAIEGLRSQEGWKPDEVDEAWQRISELLRKTECVGAAKGRGRKEKLHGGGIKNREGREKKKEWLKKWKESGEEVDKQKYKKAKMETK